MASISTSAGLGAEGKKQSENNSTSRIAAIDFGTANCSLAYIVGGKIRILNLSENHIRVPTALLAKRSRDVSSPEVTVLNVGLSAQQRHHNLSNSDSDSYLYFEFFKMNLRNEEKISRNMMISSFQNENYYLLEVIALMLQHIKAEFEKRLKLLGTYIVNASHSRELKATDFTWVITVPAIWQDKGKQMMREAAYKAGLLCNVTPIKALTPVTEPLAEQVDMQQYAEKLVLALEPECAGLYCHRLTSDMVASYSNPVLEITSRKCYMIVDIGGGTVDIAIHNFESTTNTIHSVLPPIGNDWGGSKVNEEFSLLLQKIVNDSQFQSFSSHKVVLNEVIFRKFEDMKQIFGADKQDSVHVRLNTKFIEFYGENRIKGGVKTLGDDRLNFDGEVLIFNSSKMEELFAPAVQGILDCVTSAFEKSLVDINTVYLVGGFGGCQYIFNKVNELLSKKYPKTSTIVPEEYKTAICKGAIIFQQNPNMIFSRISSAYYGIEISEDWEPGKHEESRAEYNKELKRVQCRYVFDVFIQKNQVIKHDDSFEKIYLPNGFSDCAYFDIYRTLHDGIKYTKDEKSQPIPGVIKIGKLKITVDSHSNHNIRVTFYIGRTELQVTATHVANGEEVNTKLEFLS